MAPRGALPLALAACAALVGCGSGGQDLTQPLTALPSCGPPPEPATTDVPEGLVLPGDAVITRTVERGPLTQVAGYVPRTPVEVRLFYESSDVVRVVTAEDEVFEAEVLVTDGTTRAYVKAVAQCAKGSTLDVLVGPESAAGDVPVPSGAATPSG